MAIGAVLGTALGIDMVRVGKGDLGGQQSVISSGMPEHLVRVFAGPRDCVDSNVPVALHQSTPYGKVEVLPPTCPYNML